MKKKPTVKNFPNVRNAQPWGVWFTHAYGRPAARCNLCGKQFGKNDEVIATAESTQTSIGIRSGLFFPPVLHRKCAWHIFYNPLFESYHEVDEKRRSSHGKDEE